jgi:hypothetical protein
MASYLRPRRGKAATATSQNIVLKRGEIFFETPTGGVGTGIGKLKMGDGSTSYSSLPYFLQQLDLSDSATKCAFTNVTAATASSNNSTYLNNIIPGNSLKTLFQNIKQLLLNFNSQLTSLNNDLGSIIKFQSYSKTVTFSSGTWTDIRFDINTPSGYEFLSLSNFHHYGYNGNYPVDGLALSYVNVNSSTLMIGFYNTSSATTKDIWIGAWFIKSSCKG